MDDCGCVFCRGDLPYPLTDGVLLEINKKGDLRIVIPMISVYQGLGDKISERLSKYTQKEPDFTPNTKMVIEAGSLFDRCPWCGRSLGKNYPIEIELPVVQQIEPVAVEEPTPVVVETPPKLGFIDKVLMRLLTVKGETDGRQSKKEFGGILRPNRLSGYQECGPGR